MGKSIIKHKQSQWGEIREVTLPFTPECDGLFRTRVSMNSGTAYFYLGYKKDSETIDAYWLCTPYPNNGGQTVMCAEVYEGMTYFISASANIHDYSCYFIPLN